MDRSCIKSKSWQRRLVRFRSRSRFRSRTTPPAISVGSTVIADKGISPAMRFVHRRRVHVKLVSPGSVQGTHPFLIINEPIDFFSALIRPQVVDIDKPCLEMMIQ